MDNFLCGSQMETPTLADYMNNESKSKTKYMFPLAAKLLGWFVSGHSYYRDPTTGKIIYQRSLISLDSVMKDPKGFKERYPDAQIALDIKIGVRRVGESIKYLYMDVADVLNRFHHMISDEVPSIDASALELILNASVNAFFNHHSDKLCENHVIYGYVDKTGKRHSDTYIKIKLGDRKLKDSTRRGGFWELPKNNESHTISWTYT